MGGKFELADDPIWWCIHAILWEAELAQEDDPDWGSSFVEEPASGGDMEELKEWLKLWQGFGAALVKGWALVGVAFVAALLLLR